MSAEARREQLLDAAKAVVAEHGFHGVSIEAVARGAGVTRPIVYRHFRDLGALLDALIERETLRALVQLQEVLPAGVDDLLSAFDGYLRAVRSDPVTWRLVLVTPDGAPPLLRERIAAGRAAVVAQLAAAERRMAAIAATGVGMLGGLRLVLPRMAVGDRLMQQPRTGERT